MYMHVYASLNLHTDSNSLNRRFALPSSSYPYIQKNVLIY